MNGRVGVVAVLVAVISLALAGYALSELQSFRSEIAEIRSAQTETYTPKTYNITIVNEKLSGVVQFNPSTIVVYEGDTVNLSIKNQEDTLHSFAIDEYNIHVELPGNHTTIVTIVADKPGIFTFYCFLHPKHLHGQLIVLS